MVKNNAKKQKKLENIEISKTSSKRDINIAPEKTRNNDNLITMESKSNNEQKMNKKSDRLQSPRNTVNIQDNKQYTSDEFLTKRSNNAFDNRHTSIYVTVSQFDQTKRVNFMSKFNPISSKTKAGNWTKLSRMIRTDTTALSEIGTSTDQSPVATTPALNETAKETQVHILAEFQEILELFKDTDALLHVQKEYRRSGNQKVNHQLVKTLESITSSFEEFKKLNKTTSEVVIKRMVRANMKHFYQILVDIVAPRYGVEAFELLTKSTFNPAVKFDPLPMKCVPKKKTITATSSEELMKMTYTYTDVLTLYEIAERQHLTHILNNEELTDLIDKSIFTWGPDIFRLDDISNRMVLSVLAYSLFVEREFFRKFSIPEDIFFQYMVTAEKMYRYDVRYHNHVHGADVMQSAHMVLSTVNHVSEFEKMALLFACSIHDIAHPGTNNPYMVADESPMAELYNCESVLENFHYDTGIKLLSTKGCDFLQNMPRPMRIAFKKLVKILILATDMSNHINILSVFRQKLARKKDKRVEVDGRNFDGESGFIVFFDTHFGCVKSAKTVAHLQGVDSAA